MLLQCLYCRAFKDKSEFSGEHVIPQAMGGIFEPTNPFKLHNVCKRCNNMTGLYVDAPFLRSFSVHNGRADSELQTIKPGPKTTLPLTFLGRHCSLKHGIRICELWLGPTGDLVYHFHEPYPKEPDWSIAIGPPPGKRKPANVDHGFVFFFLRSNNPTWLPTIPVSYTHLTLPTIYSV